jgi:hypothetical protein
MARELVIPGGNKKGTPLSAANAQDIGYWLKRIEGDLASGKTKAEYAESDRAWAAGARAELARRKAGGAQQQAPASAPASPPAQQQRPSTALATRGSDKLAGSFHDTNAAAEALREAAAQFHLVSPATHCGAIPEGCGVAISMVHVNPDDSKDGPGEVYGLSGGKVGLSGTTLKKIGAAAAIDWNMAQSGRLDDGRDPHYCHFRAVGTVMNFDGSRRTISGEVEIDARDGSPQLEEIKSKAASRDRGDGGESQIRELRKFLLRHAETKAKLRAIADMGVKRSYTKVELQKPFAVARLMWTGQTKDPELKKLFAAKQFDAMVGGGQQLYGRDATLVGPQANRGPALPAATHAPPPIGSVREPLDDVEDDYDTRGTEEPPADPPKTADAGQPVGQPVGDPVGKQQKLDGLPPEQDRGDNPNDY